MAELIDKNKLLEDIYNDNPQDIMKYIAKYPKCKQGEWEYGYTYPDGKYVKCSECQEIIKCIYPMKYCPNCGADMRGSENDK